MFFTDVKGIEKSRTICKVIATVEETKTMGDWIFFRIKDKSGSAVVRVSESVIGVPCFRRFRTLKEGEKVVLWGDPEKENPRTSAMEVRGFNRIH